MCLFWLRITSTCTCTCFGWLQGCCLWWWLRVITAMMEFYKDCGHVVCAVARVRRIIDFFTNQVVKKIAQNWLPLTLFFLSFFYKHVKMLGAGMIFDAVPNAIASNDEMVVLGGVPRAHFNIRVAYDGLLSRRQLPILLIVQVANTSRKSQIAINSPIFNWPTCLFNSCKFILIFWFMVVTQRVCTSHTRSQHTSAITRIGAIYFATCYQHNTTSTANLVWYLVELSWWGIAATKFSISLFSLLLLHLLSNLDNQLLAWFTCQLDI